jgi:DNA-binding LacI/PurR family transcriptional regulator
MVTVTIEMPPSADNPGSEKRPTVRRVAEIAGVSAMTVSRALRNNPRVIPSERKRIQKIATKLGYRPDPEVAKLMSHLRRRDKAQLVASIAAVTSIPETIEPPQLRKAYDSARARAAALGYRLELFHVTGPERFNRSLERTLVNRGIEGVLLLQMVNPVVVDAFLSWDKFSVTVASPSVLGPDFSRAGVNYFHNARVLGEQLALRGCRRIGFVGSDTFCVRTNEAFSAAAAWQNLQAGEKPVKPLVFKTYDEMTVVFDAWLKRERPDAIIAHAENILSHLKERLALHSGGQVLLTCTSINSPESACPGIDERHELIGHKAVDILTGQLNRNEKNIRSTHAASLIDGRWVEPVSGK